MNIIVNGTANRIDESQLVNVLNELGYENLTIATAVNGEFVPLSLRGNVILSEGDKLEIVAPMQGG